MSKPVTPWPYEPGTTRGTGLEAVEKWEVSRPPTRYTETHRCMLVEIEPDELPHAMRQAADERLQHARYTQAQAGSREGVADMEDAEKPPMTPAQALALVAILSVSAVLSVGIMAIVWGAL